MTAIGRGSVVSQKIAERPQRGRNQKGEDGEGRQTDRSRRSPNTRHPGPDQPSLRTGVLRSCCSERKAIPLPAACCTSTCASSAACSVQAQSRCHSEATASQVIMFAPAAIMRWIATSWASTETAPDASVTTVTFPGPHRNADRVLRTKSGRLGSRPLKHERGEASSKNCVRRSLYYEPLSSTTLPARSTY